MLSKRIIGSLIVKDGIVVQSLDFKRYLPVGSPEVAVEFLNQWGVDEIIVLDITASKAGEPDYALVERLAKKTRVPLGYGGGIRTLEAMRRLVAGGADKLVINTAARENSDIVSEAAAVFGQQCIIVSIDVHEGESGVAEAVERALVAQKNGAGEILVRCIERDGSKRGFDPLLVEAIASTVQLPVIAAGGCGSAMHAADALAKGAAAVAIGNILHFTEQSVITIKQQLKQAGVPVRLDTYATYDGFAFDNGRPQKPEDEYLSKLRFEYHPPEII